MAEKRICRLEDIPVNSIKECAADDGSTVLIANANGNVHACNAICPHQEVPLCEGMFDGKVLTCHMHLWQWDIATGDPIGLAEVPLETFDVDVRDGWIHVTTPD